MQQRGDGEQQGGDGAQQGGDGGQGRDCGQQRVGGQRGGGQQGLWGGITGHNSSILGGSTTEHVGGGSTVGHLL